MGHKRDKHVQRCRKALRSATKRSSQKTDDIPIGTIRIKASDLDPYQMTKDGWKRVIRLRRDLECAYDTISLFRACGTFDHLIDKKDPRFLKGQLSADGKVQGSRVDMLPDAEKLEKAYSLFSKNLIVHDQSTDDHWDVLYENIGGTLNYIYTIKKREEATRQKYKKVEIFEKRYPLIRKKAACSLKDPDDQIALPMYTLLKTYMRVGSEVYYKANGHKGLTTLTRHDIRITGDNVTFNYIGKDGVPITITESFPPTYIRRLKELLRGSGKSPFIFKNEQTKRPLNDTHFRCAFKRYCGEEFYPHIVRSYYATSKAKGFIEHKKQRKEPATLQEIRELFIEIASKLGHKRYDKKRQEWVESYTVTVNHYIQPEIVTKIHALVRPMR